MDDDDDDVDARRSDDSTFQMEVECWKALVAGTAPDVQSRVALNHSGIRALKTIRDVKRAPKNKRTKSKIDAAIHEFARSVLDDTRTARPTHMKQKRLHDAKKKKKTKKVPRNV